MLPIIVIKDLFEKNMIFFGNIVHYIEQRGESIEGNNKKAMGTF